MESSKNNNFALKYASDRLKDNQDFVLKVLHNSGFSIYFASRRLLNNKEFILKALSIQL